MTYYTISLIKTLVKLYSEYERSKKQLAPDEFVGKKVTGRPGGITEWTATKCLHLIRHERFLTKLADHFCSYTDARITNKTYVVVLLYYLIFLLDASNYTETIDIYTKLYCTYCPEIIAFLTVDNNLVNVAQEGCKSFGNDYVLERILQPLVNKKYLLEGLYKEVIEELQKCNTRKDKLTKPVGPSLLERRLIKYPPPPANTPQMEMKPFKHSSVPDLVYVGDAKLRSNLAKSYEENKKNALQLLEQAHKRAFRCAVQEKATAVVVEESKLKAFKASKAPVKKDVQVKTNAATVVRCAAAMAKEEEAEIKNLENITLGGCNAYKIIELENELRYLEEQEKLNEIERKHLEGLLSREEAILARQNLIKQNQDKLTIFKREREEMMQEVEKWRINEEKKLKMMFEKGRAVPLAVRQAGQKLLIKRQRNAKLIDSESKRLLRETIEAREDELRRKAKLIQELRAMHQMQLLQTKRKEFDPTDCPNFGLLCEMSIAELQERLALLKLEMEEELENRRKYIIKQKEQRRKVVEDAEDFIRYVRNERPKLQPVPPIKLEVTPEVEALRKRLTLVKGLLKKSESVSE